MSEEKIVTLAARLREDGYPERCPICGMPVCLVYPEIVPGIRNAACQYGHKVRLRKDNPQKRNAG